MSIHIIAVAYERPIELRLLIDSFILQTNKDWELKIIHDGPATKSIWDIINGYKDKRVEFWESKDRYGYYGHPNRQAMLKKLKGKPNDFVLITNDDNYYVPKFIEYFMGVIIDDVGIVYCDTVHSHAHYAIHYSILREGGIDMGAFIVRLDIAQKVGFNSHSGLGWNTTIDYSADGFYASECYAECLRLGLKAVYVNKSLFVHN